MLCFLVFNGVDVLWFTCVVGRVALACLWFVCCNSVGCFVYLSANLTNTCKFDSFWLLIWVYGCCVLRFGFRGWFSVLWLLVVCAIRLLVWLWVCFAGIYSFCYWMLICFRLSVGIIVLVVLFVMSTCCLFGYLFLFRLLVVWFGLLRVGCLVLILYYLIWFIWLFCLYY